MASVILKKEKTGTQKLLVHHLTSINRFMLGLMLKGLSLVLTQMQSQYNQKMLVLSHIGALTILKKNINAYYLIGAKEHGEIQDVGEDIKVATVVDPFGNLVGIIYNPNFKAE